MTPLGLGLLNGVMLLGLLGAALPLAIHLLNRRRDDVVEWGAMQFLEIGRQDRRKIRLTELLLLFSRMAVLGVVALALARPFWSRSSAGATAGGGFGDAGAPRDVVLILDGSASMDRKAGGTSPRMAALQWARRFVGELRPGDSVAVLIAGNRVRGLVDPPSFDRTKVDAALAGVRASHGSSDLPTALAEAFRILERTGNPGRDVIILSDGQRLAWRPGEARLWALVRELHRGMPLPPRVWSVDFGSKAPPDGPNGSLGPLVTSRTILAPGMPIEVTTTLANAGPGPLTRKAELLVDGLPAPGASQDVGPIPAGGKAPLSFRTTLPTPGAHLLAVRLVGGDDSLPGDDESAAPVEVVDALHVLLVDGEPGLEPLSGEVDFLRAALAPTGEETAGVIATVVAPDRFNAEALKGQDVAVLANVARLSPEQSLAIARFLDSGGGLLIAPGDRTDVEALNRLDAIPARLGPLKGNPDSGEGMAHPAPRSFVGPAMAPFAEGESPSLARADLFTYRQLTPESGASVIARLDTGDPWVVERPQGRGRVMILAAPIDAETGTLPVNPDFVPLVHEWAFHLAGGSEPKRVRPGEPLVIDLAPAPDASVKALPLRLPSGATVQAPVTHASGAASVHIDSNESGVYRLTLPDPPGGFAYASVVGDGRESDPALLEPAEASRLSEGWPFLFESNPTQLAARLFAPERGGRRELWRGLIFLALGGLCLEIYLSRRLVRRRGEA